MPIVAKVFEFEITQVDLERECAKVSGAERQKCLEGALKRLIDRCLLLYKAIETGIKISDDEYDNAIWELLDKDDALKIWSTSLEELSPLEMEKLLKQNLMINKYINSVCPQNIPVTNAKIQEFYEEQKEYFLKPEQVHCSHILISNNNEDSKAKAMQIRQNIHNAEDFTYYCQKYSECPSNSVCGDLGWFPRGKMIPEIEEVAFSLNVGEISQPFLSPYGYHILMKTGQKDKEYIPFEEIKDSLYARVQQIEREYRLLRHLNELHRKYAAEIVIYTL
ncbi:MAG: Foldase protein PrsA precursor [Candidatus Cloacimonetes bacterium ADurb.Bin089]|nr:MAG: Foldase protein PrsA precursor [Candidatus Cloacimonetes bacterium ADurb.Bin089]